MTSPPLIEVEDLRIDLNDRSGQVAAVEGVSRALTARPDFIRASMK